MASQRSISYIAFGSLVVGCGPIIPIPPGTPTSEVVLSDTNPGTTFEQFSLDGRTYRAPMLAFEIPAGRHTTGVRYSVTIADQCDPEESLCTATVTTGACSGEFEARVDERYRLLLDTRHGGPVGSVKRRGVSSLYLGQDEEVVATLECQEAGRETRQTSVGIATF